MNGLMKWFKSWYDHIFTSHKVEYDNLFGTRKEEFVQVKNNERAPGNKDFPILSVGETLNDSSIKCEIVSYTEEDFRVKILEIHWLRLGTYLDVGQTYPLRSCFSGKGMRIWEIHPDTMKRSASQVLLAWEQGFGWSWDLDM